MSGWKFIINLLFMYYKVTIHLTTLNLGVGSYYAQLKSVFKKHLPHSHTIKLLAPPFSCHGIFLDFIRSLLTF